MSLQDDIEFEKCCVAVEIEYCYRWYFKPDPPSEQDFFMNHYSESIKEHATAIRKAELENRKATNGI